MIGQDENYQYPVRDGIPYLSVLSYAIEYTKIRILTDKYLSTYPTFIAAKPGTRFGNY